MADEPYAKRPRTRGMAQALAALHAPQRQPTYADRPPPSTFPLTRAAKVALELWERKGEPRRSERT